MKIHLLAIGKLRGPFAELCADYAVRLGDHFLQKELSAPSAKAEGEALLRALPAKAFVVVLDERGKDLSSRELSDKIALWRDENGVQDLVFLIGGADGHGPEVKARADFLLGLGRKTWPHKMARLMLIEQLYRAQQIGAGHPYHRD